MLVTVDIPDQLARQYHLDDADCAHQLLVAFVLQRYAEGDLSARQVGEVLGLSFHETETFLHEHRAPSGVSPEHHERGLQNLKDLLAK
jgi:hypothetical protein